MIISNRTLDQQQLTAVCNVLADTTQGLTKSELAKLLGQSGIEILDDGSSRTQYGFTPGLNKRDWLYNCLVNEINKTKTFIKVFSFLEAALNPAMYTKNDKREKYHNLLEGTNKVLLLAGLEINYSGKIIEATQAQTLSEVDRRVSHIKKALYDRSIHPLVVECCTNDLVREDYYDAVFEASKELAERIRKITGLTADGSALFQTAFSSKDPWIFFNTMKTESERNEFQGLKELLDAIFHLVRNPAAHTPKINWQKDEVKALDVLTLISFAHKYLDECHPVPHKNV